MQGAKSHEEYGKVFIAALSVCLLFDHRHLVFGVHDLAFGSQ
ncbi:hypothetical protein RV10_GL004827 [Enterococcus pallens]|nr:hypothetical protein RV10_GL004827 [Enterococcus pallens]